MNRLLDVFYIYQTNTNALEWTIIVLQWRELAVASRSIETIVLVVAGRSNSAVHYFVLLVIWTAVIAFAVAIFAMFWLLEFAAAMFSTRALFEIHFQFHLISVMLICSGFSIRCHFAWSFFIDLNLQELTFLPEFSFYLIFNFQSIYSAKALPSFIQRSNTKFKAE